MRTLRKKGMGPDPECIMEIDEEENKKKRKEEISLRSIIVW